MDGSVQRTLQQERDLRTVVEQLQKKFRLIFESASSGIALIDYKVRVLDTGKGTGAVTRVLLESTDGVRTWSTMGVSENIIEASWQALADSVTYGLLHADR